MSSFGSPNKVVSLSQRKTASPGHGASGSNNTTARIKITPPFFAYTFGQCFANLPTSWRRHVGRVWMSRFRGAWSSLKFNKEYLFGFETLVFATSGILSMHKQLVTLQRERKTWNRIIWPLKKTVSFISKPLWHLSSVEQNRSNSEELPCSSFPVTVFFNC